MSDDKVAEVVALLEQVHSKLINAKAILCWLYENHHEGAGMFENKILEAIELIGD